MTIIFLLIGLVLGFVLGWLLSRMKNTPGADLRTLELDRSNAALQAQLTSVTGEKQRLLEEKNQERIAAENSLQKLRQELDKDMQLTQQRIVELTNQLGIRTTENTGLQEKLNEQKVELQKLQEQFTAAFENLANRIFEEKSKKFTEQNRTQIDDILKPLGEKIKDFEKKVSDGFENEIREKASLKEQLSQLHLLNQQMSKDAQNLTNALKGESKTRGNWGEFILESILEKSGLVRDREYFLQQSLTTEDGKRLQPDVVIHLPEGKHLVIDSKVSLVAYERITSSETDEERMLALKEHLVAVRRHIKELSDKNYHQLYDLQSLDFVLLFIPVEPAFATAVQGDPGIFEEAFDKNIVIVSPSTLLATLRTVASIWRQEQQNRHALEIARQGGALYDKFVGFTEDLLAVGKKMNEAKTGYDEAMKKLSSGAGNLVKRAEDIKKLGAKASKSLHKGLVDNSEDESKSLTDTMQP